MRGLCLALPPSERVGSVETTEISDATILETPSKPKDAALSFTQNKKRRDWGGNKGENKLTVSLKFGL